MRKRSILFCTVCCILAGILCGASGLFTGRQTHSNPTVPEISEIQLEHLRIIPDDKATVASNRAVPTIVCNQVLTLMPTFPNTEITLTVPPEQFEALTEAFS